MRFGESSDPWVPRARCADGRLGFTVGELAGLTGVSVSTLRRWAFSGVLEADVLQRGAVRHKVVFPAEVVAHARELGLFTGGVRAVPVVSSAADSDAVRSEHSTAGYQLSSGQTGSRPMPGRSIPGRSMPGRSMPGRSPVGGQGPGAGVYDAAEPSGEGSGSGGDVWDVARWADRAKVAELEREVAELKLSAALERYAAVCADNVALRAALRALLDAGDASSSSPSRRSGSDVG